MEMQDSSARRNERKIKFVNGYEHNSFPNRQSRRKTAKSLKMKDGKPAHVFRYAGGWDFLNQGQANRQTRRHENG